MNIIRKTVAERDGMDFVLSDDTLDRYGDVIEAKGWVLQAFKKNPIALFGHNAGFPIGNWTNVRVEGRKLIGTLQLAAKGTSQRIDELINLVEQGVLRAVSVGFRPLESEPIDKNQPYGGQRYTKQELLETSLVSVPANPAALALARSLNVSSETMSLAFGEQAEVRRRDLSTTGGHAENNPDNLKHKGSKVETTLSKRIENVQSDLNAKRDRLAELNGADDLDLDAIEEMTEQVDLAERTLAALKASEAKIGLGATGDAPREKASPQARRPLSVGHKDVSGFDLIVRAAAVRGIAHFGGKSVEDVLQERYPGHEATALITKADQTIGTTTVSGWASEIVQTAYADFLQALMPYSVYPALRDRGIRLSFDGVGTVSIPSRTAGGAGGGFVAEGAPIRVGRITTAATTMTPKKMGVIVPFSRELAKRSTPMIESLVRQAILEDTGIILDSALLDATAASTARPAGLLNGVSAVSAGYGGGDYQAVVADFKSLLAPFITANAADGITVIMNPSQGLALDLMPGPDGSGGLGDWFGKV